MNEIIWYEFTYLLNNNYYLTIALEWSFTNYEDDKKIFDKNLQEILKNKYIYINKTHYEFDYINYPIDSKIIKDIKLYHIQPTISKRRLKSKYYFDYKWKENFIMDSEEELSIDLFIKNNLC